MYLSLLVAGWAYKLPGVLLSDDIVVLALFLSLQFVSLDLHFRSAGVLTLLPPSTTNLSS